MPGKVWIATFVPPVFWVALVVTFCVVPELIRESLLLHDERTVISPQDLVDDDSMDPKLVTLHGVRVETLPERIARGTESLDYYMLHPTTPLADDKQLVLGVICQNARVPGMEIGGDAAAEPPLRDLGNLKQWPGVLRRPPAILSRIAYFLVGEQDDVNEWRLYLDGGPAGLMFPALFFVAGLLICGCSFAVMMGQNWLPNTSPYAYLTAKGACVLGWPWRKYRDRWSVCAAGLFLAPVLIGLGVGSVLSADAGVVVGPGEFGRWAGAFGVWVLGFSLVLRVLWVMLAPVPSAQDSKLANEVDDERIAVDPLIAKTLVRLRKILGGVMVMSLPFTICGANRVNLGTASEP